MDDIMDSGVVLALSLITSTNLVIRTPLLHCCPDAFLTGHTSPHLAQPVFHGLELLLKMIDFDMYILPLPVRCNSTVSDDLTYLIRDDLFCCAVLFVASAPMVVVPLLGQPAYDHCHRVDFWCRTIFLPWHPTFIFAFSCCWW